MRSLSAPVLAGSEPAEMEIVSVMLPFAFVVVTMVCTRVNVPDPVSSYLSMRVDVAPTIAEVSPSPMRGCPRGSVSH